MSSFNQFHDRVGFAIGTGRCGTKFLYEAMRQEHGVASCHERNAINETFHRYCKFNQLPVDHRGFLETKTLEVQEDLSHRAF